MYFPVAAGVRWLIALMLGAVSACALAQGEERLRPVLLGIDAEFGLAGSVSAQAIELGARAAIAEINAAGGVLGGRPLKVVTTDNRSIPARARRNVRELAAMPDLVAIFGGRFSPAVLEVLPIVQELGVPFMAVWSAADNIVKNGMDPNFVFRLSVPDSLAMTKMLDTARQRGMARVGLLLTNTAWGRSALAGAENFAQTSPDPRIVSVVWYNWAEKSLIDKYQQLRAAGAEGIVLVANDDEAAILIREMAQLPSEQRLPILSHWGITGGQWQAGAALEKVDLSVVQTFSFFRAEPAALERFLDAAAFSGIKSIDAIRAPVGVAHAYDMTHILAKAIEIAGSTEREKVRDALEKVPEHDGLIKTYRPPFTPSRHEALGLEDLHMARYRADHVIVPDERSQ